MHNAVLFLNLLVSLASAAASISALVRPALLSGSRSVAKAEMFYVRMYAARAIPFGLTAGLIPFWSVGATVAWILFTATAIQVLDVVIAVGKKEWAMTIGASVGAMVHLLCGLAI